MKLTKEQLKRIIKEELSSLIGEGYKDYDPDDEFTDSRTKSGGYSSHTGRLGDETDFDGPLPTRGHSGGYSSHTGRLGDEQHDGSYEIPKWKVPSNLSGKQKKDFNIAMDIIQNTYDKYGGGPAVIKALNNAVKYGLDYDAAQMANRAYAEQMNESKKAKLTKKQLQRIIKEELQAVMTEERGWKPGIYGIDDQGRLADGPFENIEDLRNHYDSYGGDAGNEQVESGEWVYSLVHPDKKGLEALEGGLMFLSRNGHFQSDGYDSIIGYLEDGLDLPTAIEASGEKLNPKVLAGLGIEQGLQEET